MARKLKKQVKATIFYRLDGVIREWEVGCSPEDDEDVLMRHLWKFIPNAEFIRAVIEKEG